MSSHKRSRFTPRRSLHAAVVIAVAGFITGCATTPDEPIAALQNAQAEYAQARRTPRIDDFANRAMQQAQQHLQRAEELAEEGADRDQVEHYAFLAEKHVEIAEARLQRGLIQEEISAADKRQQELMLQAERRQSARSREEAMMAQQRAEAAEQELEQARERAQQLATEVEDLQVKEDERGMIFTLSDVVFDFDSAELNEGGKRSVRRVAETLAEYPEGQILIEGYTDSVGAEEYNQALSERRARSVKEAFVDAGIPEERIRVEGLGEQYPVASNETDQGRQMNRRVEIVVATDGEPVSRRTAASS